MDNLKNNLALHISELKVVLSKPKFAAITEKTGERMKVSMLCYWFLNLRLNPI